MRSLTLLERAILALLLETPRSGYDIRRLFETTPIGNYSGGPGAIYPALRRLQARGLAALAPADPMSARGRTTFRLSARGRAEVVRWLRESPTREDIIWHVEAQVLKFAFMGSVLSRAEVSRFLRAYQREASAYVRELRKQLRDLQLPAIPRLALEHGILLYEGRARWAARAMTAFDPGGRRARRTT